MSRIHRWSVVTVPGIAAWGLALLLSSTAAASMLQQQFQLRPGWNSIYMELEPDNSAVSTVFSDAAIECVWTYVDKTTPVQFILDQDELPWDHPGWRRYFPPTSEKRFLNNLHAVHANTAYLVKTGGGASVTLTVQGRPLCRTTAWVPDSFNLRGFPVDPAMPPTFGFFFQSAPAHAGQRIYRLDGGGEWLPALSSDVMQSGEAYWVYSRGASDFTAPLEVLPALGDGLAYESTLNELSLQVRNRHGGIATAGFEDLFPDNGCALAYRTFDALDSPLWTPLTVEEFEPGDVAAQFAETFAAGESRRIPLAVRRQAFQAATYETVVQVRDFMGTRQRIAVSASRNMGVAEGGGVRMRAAGAADAFAGLWVGNATLGAVNEPHSPVAENRTNATPAGSEFSLRLLVHVDSGGQARLLKEVIQLWEDGAYVVDPVTGVRTVDTNAPGRFVLLTDDALIPQFQGAVLRDGQPVGRRLSTVSFDFEGQSLPMSGAFHIPGSLTATLRISPDFPTNPFRHPYHPDHDNRRVVNGVVTDVLETPDITRVVMLRFDTNAPPDLAVADYGYGTVAGDYDETISGLHSANLRVKGRFVLKRVAETSVLNAQ